MTTINVDSEKEILSIDDWYFIEGKWHHCCHDIKNNIKYVDGEIMLKKNIPNSNMKNFVKCKYNTGYDTNGICENVNWEKENV